MSRELVPVSAALHPFKVQYRSLTVPYGTTISGILEEAGVPETLAQFVNVEVGGIPVAREWWRYVHPRTSVTIKVVPRDSGNGEKDPTRTLLLLGVTLVGGAIASGALLGGFTGAAAAEAGVTFTSIALGTAVTLAGRALVNHIVPPPSPEEFVQDDFLRRPSLTGARNRVRPWRVVPRVFGQHRMVPPLAARPFTEIQGNDQYLNLLLCWGYGPVDITDVRIGDTSITSFQGVTNLETVSDTATEGFPSGFKQTVAESMLSIGLTQGVSQTRTTSGSGDKITVDVTFPQGLFRLDSKGKRQNLTVAILVEFAEEGTGIWHSGGVSVTGGNFDVDVPSTGTRINRRTRGGATGTFEQFRSTRVTVDKFRDTIELVNSYTSRSSAPDPPEPDHAYSIAIVRMSSDDGITSIEMDSSSKWSGFDVTKVDSDTINVADGTINETIIGLTSKRAATLRLSERIATPDSTKKYDVRLTRQTADHDDDDKRFSESVWTALRITSPESPVKMLGIALTWLRIKATDQLNGSIDAVNAVVDARMKAFDTVDQVWLDDAITSAPESAYRYVLEGSATERNVDESRLDVDALETWAQFNVDNGFEYNRIVERETSVPALLSEIASAGRAARGMSDGLWSVIIDTTRTNIVQHFTPRNSRGFSTEKAFFDKTHGIRARFNNRDKDWQQDEILVFNDDFDQSNATRYEVMELPGITKEEQAFRAARYHLAVDELRPEVYTFTVGIDSLVAQRGDLIRATHDVPQWGSGYGRISEVILDINGDIGEFRLDTQVELVNGEDYVVRVRLADGTSNLIDVVNPTANITTDTFTPVTPISIDRPQVDDLAMVGINGKESVELIIKSIEPREDFEAVVTALDYSPAIFDAHTEPIPAFDPRITDPSAFTRAKPPAPLVTGVNSGAAALKIGPDGSLSPRIIVSLSIPGDIAYDPVSDTEEDTSSPSVHSFQLRYREAVSADEWLLDLRPAEEQQVVATDVEEGVAYTVEVRSVSRLGIVSNWVVASSSHTVVGKTAPPADVQGFQVNAARDRIEFEWDANVEVDVVGYEIREGTSWDTATRIVRTDSTKHQTRSPSNGPWLIKAFDSVGNFSVNAVSAAIALSLSTSSGLTAQVISNQVLLRWSTTIGTFDLDTHEIRKGSDLDTAEVVGVSDKTFDIIQEIEGAKVTYWVIPIDRADNEGTVASITVDVDDPPDFVFSGSFQTDWQGFSVSNLIRQFNLVSPYDLTTEDFTGLLFDGVDDYVALDHSFATTQATLTFEIWFITDVETSNIIASWDRTEYFRMEIDGSAASAGHVGVAFVTDAGQEDNFGSTSYVADGRWHHVAFVYDNGTATLYVDGVQENSRSSGTELGSGTTRFGFFGVGSEATQFNGTRGPEDWFDGILSEARLWSDVRTQTEIQDNRLRTLDGNEAGLTAYWRMQRNELVETLADKSGNGNDGTIFGPGVHVPTVRALIPSSNLSRDDLVGLGYDTRDEMIADGLDYRAQPTPDTAQFVEIYDAGAVIASTNIRVTLDDTAVVGSVDSTITISVRENQGDTWTDFPAGQNLVFATQFRYIKVTVDYSKDAADDTSFLQSQDVRTVLSSKIKSDSGVVDVTANPTSVTFNVTYVDVTAITATPQGTTSRTAVIDFTDVANPTGFDVYLFDVNGNAVTGEVRWEARGF